MPNGRQQPLNETYMDPIAFPAGKINCVAQMKSISTAVSAYSNLSYADENDTHHQTPNLMW